MRSTGSERGSILVEMAFVVPILALIFLVSIDLGLVVREYQLLQNAAREGARISSLPQYQVSPLNPNASMDLLKNRVVEYCRQENITIQAGDVSVNQRYLIDLNPTDAFGSLVTVAYNRPMPIGLIAFVPGNTMRITARAVFRNLY